MTKNDLVDSLLIKMAGQRLDLSMPLSFLAWKDDKHPNDNTAWTLVPAVKGQKLSSGILVFKEGFRVIEDGWFRVSLKLPSGGSTIDMFDHGVLDDLRLGRDNYIAGMAIKRIGQATSHIAPTVWFQDEADAVDFAIFHHLYE